MPIVALEGPDRCGKTTMLKNLTEHIHAARMCPGLPYMENLLDRASMVEARQEGLWRQLYVATQRYVLDRSFTLTPEVYSKLKSRPLLLDPVPWRAEQLIIYIEVPLDELLARHRAAPDKFNVDEYEALLAAYESVLPSYDVLRINPYWSHASVARAINEHFAKLSPR